MHDQNHASGIAGRRRSAPRALLIGLVALLTSACASGPSAVVSSPVPPGISVTGHGEARGAPDIARITIGVETRGKVATEATERANQQMSAVVAAIKQHGVVDADIHTQNFSINFEQQPEPYPPQPPEPPRTPAPAVKSAEAAQPSTEPEAPRGFYRVSNTLLVTVRDLKALGAILGATTGAGANNIWGIQFEIEDPSKLEAEARERAVAEAKARAEQLARLLGVKLGKMVSVGGVDGGAALRQGNFGYSMKAAQSDVPVQSGEMTVNQDVQVVFSIE